LEPSAQKSLARGAEKAELLLKHSW
jgi:hypothetical protein